MPSPSLESSLVRILTDDKNPRQPVGAGFLVTPNHILTCAHVVNAALGRKQHAADRPDAELVLDFPLLNNRPLLRATILHWFPMLDDAAVNEIEDIAVLELLPDTPLPAEARPAPLVALDSASFFADHRVRMCGFPGGIDQGTHIDGMLKGRTGAGYWEIHPRDNSRPVEQGFSGTAAWAVQENAVCGMISSRLRRKPDQESGPVITGYMLPASALIRAFPELDQHSRPVNPYRGLEAFRKKDARFYFGRDKTVARLEEAVAEQPFVSVIGASGSGKSSLIFAGLTPALLATGDWLIAHCRPKSQPFYELAACLVPFFCDDELEQIQKTKQCAADLLTGELTLSYLLRSIIRKKEGRHFLLIVDQFEELYTLNADSTLVRRYIKGLLEAGQTEGCTALITMRADFFGTAIDYDLFAETLTKYSQINISQINEQGLREAVAQPAKILNVEFEPGLIDLIVRDVGKEPGSLPLLEFCLTQLWERQEFRRISHEAYKAIGGVQQALANHADAVYEEFEEQDRERIRHIFLKLVRPGQGTEDTRQVATIEQIQPEYRKLITRLADKRLIVTGRDEENGKETVEVVHEALIRRWRILRQWVDEERDFLVWQEILRVLLRQWRDYGRDKSALLRGLPLDEALKWRASHEEYLGDKEQEFILESEKLRECERKAQLKAQMGGNRADLPLDKTSLTPNSIPSCTQKTKILFIGANPVNTSRLRLDEEVRKIANSLKLAKERDRLIFTQEWAVTPDSLMQAIIDSPPYIIHFSGHGEIEGICLENEYGEAKVVSAEALAALFKLFKDTVQCVLLNACYSENQAKAIKAHIPYVIGMSSSIPDTTAISFASGFYKAIGAGREIPFAYELGKTAIQLQGDSGEEIPVLLSSKSENPIILKWP